ncbi:MAG: EF-hand domain-containing protein [Betaproteobacteria bacterium]|nr:MAG: EF-hand domain-containing protein [Betaproteobacteria bacterium]
MSLARILVLSASALAVASAYADRTAAFKGLDIDGDGLVSKAEAAGNAEVTGAFDRADRNRDGKLSVAEYERYTQLQARAKAKKNKQAAARKTERPASAGGTAPKAEEK